MSTVQVKRSPRVEGPAMPEGEAELAEPPVLGEPASADLGSALLCAGPGPGGSRQPGRHDPDAPADPPSGREGADTSGCAAAACRGLGDRQGRTLAAAVRRALAQELADRQQGMATAPLALDDVTVEVVLNEELDGAEGGLIHVHFPPPPDPAS